MGRVPLTKTAFSPAVLLVMTAFCPAMGQSIPEEPYRAFSLETGEVTFPCLTLSPDGKTLVFSLLGHLFRLPVEGGEATQLTFGCALDSEPILSPDGLRIAFISDRDNCGGSLFLMDLFGNSEPVPLTREGDVRCPRWSPDGKTLAYLQKVLGGPESTPLHLIKTFDLHGGQTTTVAPPAAYSGLFYLQDGRLGWMLNSPVRSAFQLMDGTLLGSVDDPVHSFAIEGSGRELYYSTHSEIKQVSLVDLSCKPLAVLKDGPSKIALGKNGAILLYGDRGKLWLVKEPGGPAESIAFNARTALLTRNPPVPQWAPPGTDPVPPRAILTPQLARDQKRLVYMAAGFIHEQALDGKPARRLLEGTAFERDPALSPDGRKLAYVSNASGKRELRVVDLENKQSKVLYSVGGASWVSQPSWSPDGERIAFQRSDTLPDPYRILSINVSSGKTDEITKTTANWNTRPHFSADGKSIYYTDKTQKFGNTFKISAQGGSKAEAVTAFTTKHAHDSLVSPDGKWIAVRRNTELWVAPFGSGQIKESAFKMLTDNCSRANFTFAPDSSALVFAGGKRIYKKSVQGGETEELPVTLKLQKTWPEPLLIKRARPLDFTLGNFGPESSILVQNGKIAWIGSEKDNPIPKSAATLDAGGRYVIPGLMDAHVHAAWSNQMASEDVFIAFGNTSVRDTGGSLDLLNTLRDRSESTNLPLPRFWYSGEPLEGASPFWGDAFTIVATEQDARQAVRKWKEWGAGFIKSYMTLPLNIEKAVVDEAHKQGLPLSGHSLSLDEMTRHINQGFAYVEHSPSTMNADTRKLLASTGTRWVGTQDVEGASEIFVRENPPVHLGGALANKYIHPDKKKHALKGRFSSYPKDKWPGLMKSAGDRIFQAYKEGAKVKAGTDALMAEVFFGLSLHWEMEIFKSAGLTPLEALRMATLDNAEAVGAEKHLGSLTPGKMADLVILDANPLEDIRNTTKLWQVIKDGQAFDPMKLWGAKTTEEYGDLDTPEKPYKPEQDAAIIF